MNRFARIFLTAIAAVVVVTVVRAIWTEKHKPPPKSEPWRDDPIVQRGPVDPQRPWLSDPVVGADKKN